MDLDDLSSATEDETQNFVDMLVLARVRVLLFSSLKEGASNSRILNENILATYSSWSIYTWGIKIVQSRLSESYALLTKLAVPWCKVQDRIDLAPWQACAIGIKDASVFYTDQGSTTWHHLPLVSTLEIFSD